VNGAWAKAARQSIGKARVNRIEDMIGNHTAPPSVNANPDGGAIVYTGDRRICPKAPRLRRVDRSVCPRSAAIGAILTSELVPD
jgi:hypothetical protein